VNHVTCSALQCRQRARDSVTAVWPKASQVSCLHCGKSASSVAISAGFRSTRTMSPAALQCRQPAHDQYSVLLLWFIARCVSASTVAISAGFRSAQTMSPAVHCNAGSGQAIDILCYCCVAHSKPGPCLHCGHQRRLQISTNHVTCSALQCSGHVMNICITAMWPKQARSLASLWLRAHCGLDGRR
jgi:hypothetical protein